MSEATFRFRPFVARRIPDPNFRNSHGLERHLFVMPVRELPRDLPLDPNARRPKTSKRVYQQVEKSLLNEDCEPNTFHLKNKGITVIAKSVRQVGDNNYVVGMTVGIHGIVDGGHTYELVMQNLDNPDLPEEQYVNVEIRVGIPETWISDIARGLNTSVQVQDMSLDDLQGQFDWIKDELKSEPYYPLIAWSENDPGEFDARDIISLMTLFNSSLYPNDKDHHPVAAYEKKSSALKEYEENIESYKRMKRMLKDILLLHDIVRKGARDMWNDSVGGRAAALAFMEHKKRGDFIFPFTGEKSDARMIAGALYPILAAFRWFVVRDPTSQRLKWRNGFDSVLEAWRAVGPELLKATHQMSDELRRNPNAIGKSRPHWANLHARVAKFDLMQRQAALAAK